MEGLKTKMHLLTWYHDGGDQQVVDTGCTRGVAKERHPGGVPTEVLGVLVDPGECRQLVHQSQIADHSLPARVGARVEEAWWGETEKRML